jgi:NDP-sugar pyrophosphorylase family protein
MGNVIIVPDNVLAAVQGSVPEDWHKHPNGKGWVYRAAKVEASAYLHPDSIVGCGASIGYHAVVGRGATIGNFTAVGNFAIIGHGAAIGKEATVGNYATIGDHTSWDTNPPQIQGSRHIATLSSLTQIAIGCQVHIITYWLKRYKAILRAERYTKEQIDEYGYHIAYLANIAARLRDNK